MMQEAIRQAQEPVADQEYYRAMAATQEDGDARYELDKSRVEWLTRNLEQSPISESR